jgi:hypothetical protein
MAITSTVILDVSLTLTGTQLRMYSGLHMCRLPDHQGSASEVTTAHLTLISSAAYVVFRSLLSSDHRVIHLEASVFKQVSVEDYRAMNRYEQKAYLEKMQSDWIQKNGLKAAKGVLCVTRLTSRGHRRSKWKDCEACDMLSYASIIDHPYMFTKQGGSIYGLDCIVVHPYDLWPENVEKLAAICSRFGLEYEVRPKSESWYNQYGTYMVIIRRKSELIPDIR